MGSTSNYRTRQVKQIHRIRKKAGRLEDDFNNRLPRNPALMKVRRKELGYTLWSR